MSSSTIEKSVTVYRGDDEVLLFSGVGPVAGLITLQVAAVFGGTTLLQSTSVDGEHGADHAAGKLAFPITAGQSASLPADSMLAYDVKIVDAGVTRSPFYGVFRVAGSITQTEFPVGMSANDVLSLLSDSSDSSKGAGLIGVLESFWSGVGFVGPFRLQGLLQWLYSKITPRIDPQTGGKLVKTVGTAGAIGESAVSESSGVLDAAGYLEGGNPFLGEHSTDELPEGAANRYYTSARENAKANVDLTNVLNTDFYDKAVASGAVGGGVSSFNSRSGAVTPQAGDYSASQVSATEAGGLSGATVQAQLEFLSASSLPSPGEDIAEKYRPDDPDCSPSFPWHPIWKRREFSASAASSFHAALRSKKLKILGTDEFDIISADHIPGSVLTGVQQLELNTGSANAAAFESLKETAFQRGFAKLGPNQYDTAYKSGPITIASINATTNVITTAVAHGIPTGRAIVFVAGTPPAPLKVITPYYARRLGNDTLSLHPTKADAENDSNILDITVTSSTAHIDAVTYNAEMTLTVPEGGISHLPAGDYRIIGMSWPFIYISGAGSSSDPSATGNISFYMHRTTDPDIVLWHSLQGQFSKLPYEDGSSSIGHGKLDQVQKHRHKIGFADNGGNTSQAVVIGGAVGGWTGGPNGSSGNLYVGDPRSDGLNGEPRNGPQTEPSHYNMGKYIFVGANTLS